MEIQIPQRCKYYAKNENMNKTCAIKGIEKMCKVYYGDVCSEYSETVNNYCDGIDCAWCAVQDCNIKNE